MQESRDIVLSLTSVDGNNFRYRLKAPVIEPIVPAAAAPAFETVSSWELEGLTLAANTGEIALPLGVALKMDHPE